MGSALRGQTGMALQLGGFRTFDSMSSFSHGMARFFASLLFYFARNLILSL